MLRYNSYALYFDLARYRGVRYRYAVFVYHRAYRFSYVRAHCADNFFPTDKYLLKAHRLFRKAPPLLQEKFVYAERNSPFSQKSSPLERERGLHRGHG